MEIDGLRVNHEKTWQGFLEFPTLGLILQFKTNFGQANIYIISTDTNVGSGYCGTKDGDEENELSIPLDPAVYGSLEHVYSAKQCEGVVDKIYQIIYHSNLNHLFLTSLESGHEVDTPIFKMALKIILHRFLLILVLELKILGA